MFNSYRIICGAGGLNGARSNVIVPPQDLIEADNIINEDSTWRRMNGSEKFNSVAITGTPQITAVHELRLSASNRMVAATNDGKIITVVSGGLETTLKSGLSANRMSVFVEAYGGSSTRKLFHFNGANVVQVWDGAAANTSDISTPPTDWSGSNQPTCGVMHNNRLFGWGNDNHPHRVYYSTVTDHEDFTSAGSGTFSVYPGEGLKLVAAISFLGRLFFFKFPFGIYWLDDSDTDVTKWVIKKLSDAVGMAGPKALCQVQQDVLFLASDGFVHSLRGVDTFGDARASTVLPDEMVTILGSRLSKDYISKVDAVFHQEKGYAYFAIPVHASSTNNALILFDVKGRRPKAFWSSKDTAISMTISEDSNGRLRPTIGDNAGFIWLLDDETSIGKDGNAYTSRFQHPEIQLATGRRINLKAIEIVFQYESSHELDIRVFTDGIPGPYYSVTSQPGGVLLDDFMLDEDTLGGSAISRWRKRINRDGLTFSVEGLETGLNTNFSISEIILYYNIGSDRLS